jgi:hypothetical protein
MARKQPNPLQQKHISEDIKFIFERIDDELFSNEYLRIANRLRMQRKLLKLQTALAEFKNILLLEAGIRKDSYAIDTARALDETICEFFSRGDADEKQANANHFWRTARRSWLTQKTKTILTGVGTGLVIFGLVLGLIIGTGGLALIGIWSVLAISLAVGLIGSGGTGLLAYKFGKNDTENHGKDVRDALIELSSDIGIISFTSERNNNLVPRSESKTVQKVREKYNLPKKDKQKPEKEAEEIAATESSPPSTTARLREGFMRFKNRYFTSQPAPKQPSQTQPKPREPYVPPTGRYDWRDLPFYKKEEKNPSTGEPPKQVSPDTEFHL